MHILKIIHGYPPDYNAGSEVYSQSICNELSKRHKVSVFTREENPYRPCFGIRKKQVSDNLTLYLVNNPFGKDGYRHRQMDENFAGLAASLHPDVAHVGHLNHLSTGIIDVLNSLQIPIVFTLHDFWLMCPRGQFLTRGIGETDNFQLCRRQDDAKCARDCYRVYFGGNEETEADDVQMWSQWVHRRMAATRAVIDKVDLFIAPSHYLKNRFTGDFGLADDKIVYLDYGFPTDYLCAPAATPEKRPYTFGYIGTHIPAKGVNLLIEAFRQIKSQAALMIFGRDNGQSTKALKQMAASSPNKIEFAGEYVNRNLASHVFSKVDCIVVPSIWGENSPLVIHETQACRIPVITANFGGMKEYVRHHVNGLLFEHRNADALAEQMAFAVANPQTMRTLGERGYLYSDDGTVPDIGQHCIEIEKIYQKIINKNRHQK